MDPTKEMERLVLENLDKNFEITNFEIDPTKIRQSSLLHVDIFQHCYMMPWMTDYDLYANIHYNVIKYVGYVSNLDHVFTSHDQRKDVIEFKYDFFFMLQNEFNKITPEMDKSIRQFLFLLAGHNRNIYATKQLHDTFYNPAYTEKLKKIIRSDLLEDIGHFE